MNNAYPEGSSPRDHEGQGRPAFSVRREAAEAAHDALDDPHANSMNHLDWPVEDHRVDRSEHRAKLAAAVARMERMYS